MTKVVCRTDRSVTIYSFSLLIWILGEVVAKFVEVMLPTRSPLGDPLLGGAQHDRLHTARAHPPHLLIPDEAPPPPHLKSLKDFWKPHQKCPAPSPDPPPP